MVLASVLSGQQKGGGAVGELGGEPGKLGGENVGGEAGGNLRIGGHRQG